MHVSKYCLLLVWGFLGSSTKYLFYLKLFSVFIFWFRISEREKKITDLQNELDSLKDAVEHQRMKNNVSKSFSELKIFLIFIGIHGSEVFVVFFFYLLS